MSSEEIKISKFLENGIEFSCQMCGDCCRGFNEGEVYLYMDDILRLAKMLKMNDEKGLRKFANEYVKVINDSFYWKELGATRGKTYKFKTLGFAFAGDDEHCHFLDENNRCTVHKHRPFQCRCFPFWKMMVTSRKNVIEYSKKCPGLKASLKGKGKYYNLQEIRKWAKAEYQMEQKYFLKMKENNFDILKVYPFLPREKLQEDK
ncbi:MAG: YkgJ family cysteine cluster protein [Candidatus Thorarchaeota archaeon]